ncbi:IS3 family transposase [Streptomyces sp. NPDC001634]|uniref:IS3 family transposase n=1 Tax=Streptomyces sp. NPDC001634 TaxID=3154390 RepID=UPI00332831F7
MAEEGFPVRRIAGILDASESGYYAWRERTPSARALRHAWLTRIILDIYRSSGSTFGYRRVRHELGRRYGINVSHGTVEHLMGQAGIHGRSGRLLGHAQPAIARVPGRRWVIDVFTYRTLNDKVCAAIVLDTTSRHLASWSTGPRPSALLIDHALDKAITQETTPEPVPGTTKGNLAGCTFTERAHALRDAPVSGTIGDWYDHTVAEAFRENVRRALADRNDGKDPKRLEEKLLEIFERFTHQK